MQVGDIVKLVNREPIDAMALKLCTQHGPPPPGGVPTPKVEVGDIGKVCRVGVDGGDIFDVGFACCHILCDEAMVEQINFGPSAAKVEDHINVEIILEEPPNEL